MGGAFRVHDSGIVYDGLRSGEQTLHDQRLRGALCPQRSIVDFAASVHPDTMRNVEAPSNLSSEYLATKWANGLTCNSGR